MEYKPYYTNMRSAFTMIELIFIMVVVGILASIALTRLFAVRDDAKITTDIASMSACISEAGMQYTAMGKDLKEGDSYNCDSVKCYNITYAHNGSNFKVETNSSGAGYCERIDDLGGHLAKTYNFHGTNVITE